MIDRVRYEFSEKAWDWAEDMSGRLILRLRLRNLWGEYWFRRANMTILFISFSVQVPFEHST